MAMLLSRSTWTKFPGFCKNGLLLAQKVFISPFISAFSFKFEISDSKLTHVPNFSQIGQKIKEARILTWENTQNCLMMSYLRHSDDVSKIIIDFERFCSRAPSCQVSGGNWATNKKNQGGGTMCPKPIFHKNIPA